MANPIIDEVLAARVALLEKQMALLEGNTTAVSARMKTLEKNSPLEARIRIVEAAAAFAQGGNGAQAGSIQKDAISLLSYAMISLAKYCCQFFCLSRWSRPPLSKQTEAEVEVIVARAIAAAAKQHRASLLQQAESAPAGYRFVLKEGLEEFSQSLAMVEDIEDCDCSNHPKLTDRAKIAVLHKEAVRRKLDHYDDPATGYEVFTAHHLKTRECCGSSCRHCPYGHRNVPGKKRAAAPPDNHLADAPADPRVTHAVTTTSASNQLPESKRDAVLVQSGAPPKSRLYTRKGDAGWGTLYNEQSILKSDAIYEAIGTVDELNSVIGLAEQLILPSTATAPATGAPGAELEPGLLGSQLESVQAWLLDVGSALCTPRDTTANARKLQRTRGVSHDTVVTLERWIDAADAQLQRLHSFILPGGSPGAAALHVARAVCRRAERAVWPLLIAGKGDEVIGVFLNRLSDFLFVAARLDAHCAGATEQAYIIQRRVDLWQRQVVS